MVSYIFCDFRTYHILLAEFGELPIELHPLKLIIGFQQHLAHVSPSWLVNKVTSLVTNRQPCESH